MDDIAFRDRAVYLADTETLVLSDLHLGRQATSNVDVPLGESTDIHTRLADLWDYFDPQRAVFAGDILHSFSTVPAGVDQAVESLYELCTERAVEPVAIRGNHDRLLDGVWPGAVESAICLADGTVICHGHAEPDPRGERYLIGHDHPAITIEGVKRPCLCVDPTGYRGEKLVILPAFTRLAGGVELNRLRADALQSPLIESVDSLQPHIWDPEAEKTLQFPPLGELRRVL